MLSSTVREVSLHNDALLCSLDDLGRPVTTVVHREHNHGGRPWGLSCRCVYCQCLINEPGQNVKIVLGEKSKSIKLN